MANPEKELGLVEIQGLPNGKNGKELGDCYLLSLSLGDVRRPESRQPFSWASAGLVAGLPCPSTGVRLLCLSLLLRPSHL